MWPARRGWRRLAAALVTVLLAGAGCARSSDGGAVLARATTTTMPTATTSTVPRDRQADQRTAEAALPTLADFPAGWREETALALDTGRKEKVRFANCIGVSTADVDDDDPEARSPDFTNLGRGASTEVAVAPSVADAKDSMGILRRAAVPGCYKRIFTSGFYAGLDATDEPHQTLTSLTVNRHPFPAMGDDVVGFRFDARVTDDGGHEQAVYTDLINVRVGRVGIDMSFRSPDEPFPADLEERLTRAVIDRVPPE